MIEVLPTVLLLETAITATTMPRTMMRLVVTMHLLPFLRSKLTCVLYLR